jgi:hypothetical protein
MGMVPSKTISKKFYLKGRRKPQENIGKQDFLYSSCGKKCVFGLESIYGSAGFARYSRLSGLQETGDGSG